MENSIQSLVYENDKIINKISRDDVDGLVKNLGERIDFTVSDLDYSHESLSGLEEQVKSYIKQYDLDEMEILQLVNEIAAYLGQTMVVNLGARWNENDKSFWSSSVRIDERTRTKKGKEIHSGPSRAWPVVQNVAYFLDMLDEEESDGFFQREFNAMKSNFWVEGK